METDSASWRGGLGGEKRAKRAIIVSQRTLRSLSLSQGRLQQFAPLTQILRETKASRSGSQSKVDRDQLCRIAPVPTVGCKKMG
jgi:hypothetical protein